MIIVRDEIRQRAHGGFTTSTTPSRVHGKTIELDEDLGMTDGQEVEVHVKIAPPTRWWGEGVLRTAGALVDDPRFRQAWDVPAYRIRPTTGARG